MHDDHLARAPRTQPDEVSAHVFSHGKYPACEPIEQCIQRALPERLATRRVRFAPEEPDPQPGRECDPAAHDVPVVEGRDERVNAPRPEQLRAPHRGAEVEGAARIEDDVLDRRVQFPPDRRGTAVAIQSTKEHMGSRPGKAVGVVHEHALGPPIAKLVDEKGNPRALGVRTMASLIALHGNVREA
jgi:hypothetical protein